MTEDQVKELRCSLLFASLDKSRKDDFLCDFTVKVGRKSFPAHRLVLANSSPYFKSLFQTKMKEVQDGLIDMKDVDTDAIELCISFMYTGEANIAMEAIQHILHASNLLQLDDLKNLCVGKMQKNLTPQNCLSTIELARLYDCFELIKSTEEFLTSNFDAVVTSEMFTSIGKTELLRYMDISNANSQTLWTAAVKWSKGQNDTLAKFTELTSNMDFQNFPLMFLSEIVLEEPLVQESEKTKNIVIKMIFNDVGKLREHIKVDNCFALKKQAETHEISNSSEVREVIFEFLDQNFEEVAKKEEFCEISKLDVTKLLNSTKIRCSDERMKYDAVIKWVKHHVKNRKKAFSELFSCIELKNLPDEFLKKTVRKESFVTESHKCNDRLLDELCSRLDKPSSSAVTTQTVPESFLSEKNFGDVPVYIHKQPEGNMSCQDWFMNCIEITYSFQGGAFQGVHYDYAKFTAYLPQESGLTSLLRKAFNAGLIFKLEVTGNSQGKIVWSDIRHKTCWIGPNGYCDPGYLDQLRQVLESKGIC